MVFYFTGTGNSLYASKQLEEKPISIPQAMRQENLEFYADSMGIVAPVYGHEVPSMVKAFLQKAIQLAMPEKNPNARYRNEHITLQEIINANSQNKEAKKHE